MRKLPLAIRTASDADLAFFGKVVSLIYNYRTLGHTQATINPLEPAEHNPRLKIEQFGLTAADLDKVVWNSFFRHGDKMKLRDMVAALGGDLLEQNRLRVHAHPQHDRPPLGARADRDPRGALRGNSQRKS